MIFGTVRGRQCDTSLVTGLPRTILLESLNNPSFLNFLSYGRKIDPSKLLTRISERQSGFREKSIFLKSL